MIIITLLLIVFIVFAQFTTTINGFHYQGIRLLVISTSMFCIFKLLPINIIKNEKLKNHINEIAKYTLGIYCIHRMIGYIITTYFINIDYKFIESMIIFIVSLIAIWIIGHIPLKIVKKSVM